MEENSAQAPAPEQTSPAVATENNAAQVEAEPKSQAEATGDDAPATEDADKPKKRADGGFQRRIGELTREFREAQRRESEANRRADELLAELRSRSATPQQPKPAGGSDESAPRQEQFASYEEYIDARADWRARQSLKAERDRETREASERQAKQTAEQRRETLQKAAAEAAEKFPDFEDVVAAADIPITPTMAEALADSEKKPELLYYLAKHPEEARSLAAKSPASQALAIGRLEERLKAVTPRTTVTDAGDPPRTVKGKGPSSPDPNKMTFEEYRKFRGYG